MSLLQAAEFLYELRLFPDLEYRFKHALTHDVVYPMTRYGLFWSADVYWTGHVHAPVQATGSQPTPWATVQQKKEGLGTLHPTRTCRADPHESLKSR